MGEKRSSTLIIVVVLIFVVPIVFTFFLLPTAIHYWFNPSPDLGQVWTGAQAIFSGWAFAALLLAVWLQMKELQLQRTELVQTRQVLDEQKQQLQAHTRTFEKQNFESTFFSLLNLHNSIVNATAYEGLGDHHQGRKCFEHWYYAMKLNFTAALEKEPTADHLTLIENVCGKFFTLRQADVGLYHKNLYNIVKFVKRSPVEQEQKRFYTNLIRAQLSKFELTLLFYNCLSSLGHEKFKPLVEEFALLKALSDGDLIQSDHKSYYDQTAFGLSEPSSP